MAVAPRIRTSTRKRGPKYKDIEPAHDGVAREEKLHREQGPESLG